MNNLPQYDNDELNAIKVIQAQTLALSEAYQGYSAALNNLID